jgi:hypothetical protein
MKLPRGFGKNYFSLSAIAATVNAVTLHQESSRVQNFYLFGAALSGEAEELDELLEEEPIGDCPLQLSLKGCHCNCFFFQKTRKSLKLFSLKLQDIYLFLTLFLGIAPPLSTFH